MPGSKSSRCRRKGSTGRVPPPPRARNTAVCCHCKIGQGGHPCARRRRDRARGADDGPNVRQRQNDDIADARRQGGALPRPSPTPAATVLAAGSEAISDYEMLELILFRAIPQRDVKPLAKELLATFGSFSEVIAAPLERLKEIDGLGEAAITELKIVQAAANRLVRGEVKQRQVLSSWSNVLDYCR